MHTKFDLLEYTRIVRCKGNDKYIYMNILFIDVDIEKERNINVILYVC